ncbi:MAG TPA: TIM barrel protein, partial [Chloroflexota bacterium]|nr:TIM barrel protein [Chloroflexota bacterium]
VERFRPIAEVLRDQGGRFGIEFIGPKTLRANFKHEFIYTMDGLLELARAIGTGNVGLLLDAYHLYTSHGQVSDLDRITADDVVIVHVNDAQPDIPVDELLDQVRALPGETGVLDLVAFMTRLDKMGYAGSVMVEPFSKRLNERAATDPEGVAREVADSLNRLWTTAGLE